jgi:hypothetical protein
MPFTAIFILFALLIAAMVFGIFYKAKGLKAAFLTSGLAFFLLVILFLATMNVLLSAM